MDEIQDRELVSNRDLVIHILVVKGFVIADVVASESGVAADHVEAILKGLCADGLARRKEGRLSGWAPTQETKELHKFLLSGSLAPSDPNALLTFYDEFRDVNDSFKEICTRWQLRGEASSSTPNDHSDETYDQSVIADLAVLNHRVATLLEKASTALGRLDGYQRRLDQALGAIEGGDMTRFTKPMSDSYHDIWMELHQDLILTLGVERTASDA